MVPLTATEIIKMPDVQAYLSRASSSNTGKPLDDTAQVILHMFTDNPVSNFAEQVQIYSSNNDYHQEMFRPGISAQHISSTLGSS